MDEAVTGNQYAFGAVPLKVGVDSCERKVVKNDNIPVEECLPRFLKDG